MRALLVAFALASCSKSAPPSKPAPQRLPILPDSIAGDLGTVGLALAVDVHGIDVAALFGAQPAKLPCAHDLIVGVRDAVATVGDGGWQGIVDGLPEAPVRACLAQLGVAVHDGSGGAIELDVHGTSLVAHWRGDVVTISQAGATARSGEAPPEMFDVIAKVPRDAKAWLAVTGLPDFKIDRAVGWLEIQPGTWTLTVTADGSTATAAKDWIDSLVRGFTVALASRGVTVDGSWFTVTQTPPTAKLIATVPVGALGTGSDTLGR